MATFALLEDDRDFASLLIASIEGEGHRVNHYLTATEALKGIEKQEPDIVVTDIFITIDNEISPDGGVKLVSQLKQVLGSRVPVIAISGSFSGVAGIPVASTVVTVGADATLAKPFRPQQLIDLANRLLNKH